MQLFVSEQFMNIMSQYLYNSGGGLQVNMNYSSGAGWKNLSFLLDIGAD